MNRATATALPTLLAAILLPALAAADDGAFQIVVEADPISLWTDGSGLTRVLSESGFAAALPGQPALPRRVVRVAVPPGASDVAVSVEPVDAEVLPGYYDVAPAGPMAVLGERRLDWRADGRRISAGRDLGIYGSDRLFPASWGERIQGIQKLRRHRYVEVSLNPVRYRPGTGEIARAGDLRISVSYDLARGGTPGRFDDCRHEELASRTLTNYEESLAWHDQDCLLPPPDTWDDMIIVTTDALADGMQNLDAYIEMREAQGHNVMVATEADWDTPTGETHDDRSDRIRKWLVDTADDITAGWLLLIGNPDPSGAVANSIPMKFCAEYDGTAAPTDYFYANLSADWDGDGDGTFCTGGDNISFTPDLYVGRIPIYSDGAVAADEVLAKIIAYEEESESGDISWRRRMMLPNSIYFFANQYGDPTPRWDGASVGEYFIRDELAPRGMEWTTLYEHEGLDSSNFESHFQVTTEEVVNQWHLGYGMVFWTGHGSDTGVYRSIWVEDNGDGYPDYQEMSSPNFMDATYAYMMEDAPLAFVVHGSCSNGSPESANNLGYSLLRRGAIGTVSASRSALTWHWPDSDTEIWEKPSSWDGDVIDIVAEYSHNLLNGDPAGKALDEAILATTNIQGLVSWYQKSIQNLYGDPLVRLVMCRETADCDNGLYCDGPETCQEGVCVPGDDIVCQGTEWCYDWYCDEELMDCVPSPECVDPDAGTDTDVDTDIDTDADTDSETGEDQAEIVNGAISSCSTFGPGETGGSLMTVLAEIL